jgi:penicillin-binding protein 1A
MAGKSRNGTRIEPSFDAGSRARRDDDLRADPRERGGRAPVKKRTKSVRGRTRSSGGGFFGLIRRAIYWSLVLCLWGGIAAAGVLVYYGSRMPNAESWAMPDRPPNIKIVDVNGELLANRGSTGGEAIPLEAMSPYIPEAVIAIEDRRFYSHFGFDPIGFSRAMARNIMSGRMVQGGSTITQQLAKNMFLTPDRTLERKVQEVLLAFWLESKYTKDQILAMYLNRVFFGSNSYGVEAASRRYFNKSARDVNLTEAAILAALLKAPSALSPAKNPKGAMERARLVLAAMEEQGYISADDMKLATSQQPPRAKSYWSGAEHYAADMVLDELPGLIGEVKEDVVVDTTLDRTLERAAEKAVQAALSKDGKRLGVSQGALVSIDGAGAIRAVVGGRDYAKSQFNRAFKAKRQPGSAFKPFVYAAALERGLTPASVFNDAPVRIGKWTPENYDNKYRGPVTLANALANSLNTIAAQLVMTAGPANVVKFAHRMGIESDIQDNASIALGTSEVSLVELTASYAPFMNGGFKASPHLIRRITTASGKVLYENKYETPPKVLSPQIAAEMNMMMAGVITKGTGKKAKLPGWQAAGKTGTTQSFRDALFVGYTSNLATGVWFGNDDGASMKKVTGGGLPAEVWSQFMTAAHQGLKPEPLPGIGGNSSDLIASTGNEEQRRDSLFDMISHALGGSDNDEQQQGGRQQDAPQGLPTQDIEQVIRQERNDTDPGLTPPMDVGENSGGQPQRRANSTLLDVIMQQ